MLLNCGDDVWKGYLGYNITISDTGVGTYVINYTTPYFMVYLNLSSFQGWAPALNVSNRVPLATTDPAVWLYCGVFILVDPTLCTECMCDCLKGVLELLVKCLLLNSSQHFAIRPF